MYIRLFTEANSFLKRQTYNVCFLILEIEPDKGDLFVD